MCYAGDTEMDMGFYVGGGSLQSDVGDRQPRVKRKIVILVTTKKHGWVI